MPIDRRNKSDMYSILDKLRQSKQLEFDSESEREKKPYYYDDDWDEYPLPKSKPSDNDNYEDKPLSEGVGPIKNLLQMFDGSAEWLATLNKQLRSKINKKELQDILKKSEYKKVDDDIAKNPEAYIGKRVKKDNINEDEIDEGVGAAVSFLRNLGGFGDDVVKKVIPDIKPTAGLDAYGNKLKPLEVRGSMSNPPTGNSMGVGELVDPKKSKYQIHVDPNLPKVSGEVNSMLTPKGTSASDLLDVPNRKTFADFVAARKLKKAKEEMSAVAIGNRFGVTDTHKVLGSEPTGAEKIKAISANIEDNFKRHVGIQVAPKTKKLSKLKQQRLDQKNKKKK